MIMEPYTDGRFEALRDLEYATSLAIGLLAELNNTRCQVRIMADEDDGKIIVCPTNCISLSMAVEQAFRNCREILTHQEGIKRAKRRKGKERANKRLQK